MEKDFCNLAIKLFELLLLLFSVKYFAALKLVKILLGKRVYVLKKLAVINHLKKKSNASMSLSLIKFC